MHSEIYWIDTNSTKRLGIMARPRAGDWLGDEIGHWKREGVGQVVSLLERPEVDELGLHDEERLCTAHGMTFVSLPIADRGLPDRGMALALARRILASPEPTAIHCRAGIGRSSVIAAIVLRMTGMDGDVAFAAIEKARRLVVPDTVAQRDWVTALQLED